MQITTFSRTNEDRVQQKTILEEKDRLAAQFGEDRRGFYAALCATTTLADGVTFAEIFESEAQGWWVTPPNVDRERAILFIHGGGYHLGDAASYRGFASQIAARTRCAVFSVNYPLAPEQRFPSAYEAVRRARDWFVANLTGDYALMGDSAGGGLTLALLSEPAPARRPASVVVFSPWTDLALTGASMNDPATYDPVFKPEVLAGLAVPTSTGRTRVTLAPRHFTASLTTRHPCCCRSARTNCCSMMPGVMRKR